MRNKLVVWFLGGLLVFHQGAAANTWGVGVSFGSPALVGLRGSLERSESPWGFQFEYSSHILEHNRSDGKMTSARFDAQRAFSEWENLQPFGFLGLTYFNGYLNKYAEPIALLAFDGGLGLRLPISSRWSLGGELGVTLPTEAPPGVGPFGLIFNLSVRWLLPSDS